MHREYHVNKLPLADLVALERLKISFYKPRSACIYMPIRTLLFQGCEVMATIQTPGLLK